MSGLEAPWRTATPRPERPISARLPATSLPSFYFLFQVGIDLEMQLDRVAGGALELRAQFLDRRFSPIAAQYPKFGGVRRRGGNKQCGDRNEQPPHNPPIFSLLSA
jgi:hypothetical protein